MHHESIIDHYLTLTREQVCEACQGESIPECSCERLTTAHEEMIAEHKCHGCGEIFEEDHQFLEAEGQYFCSHECIVTGVSQR